MFAEPNNRPTFTAGGNSNFGSSNFVATGNLSGSIGPINLGSGGTSMIGNNSALLSRTATVVGAEPPSFISGGRDCMMNIWTNNGDCMHSQTAHRGAVSFLSEINYNVPVIANAGSTGVGVLGSGSGNTPVVIAAPMLASIGADNAVRVWDLRKFKPVADLAVPPVNQGIVSKAVWSGCNIVTCSSSGAMRLYERVNYASGDCEWVGHDMMSHGSPCSDLISAESFVASGAKNGQILRWST